MKIAIYSRVSTKTQKEEGTSLESQVEACQNLAKERGFELEEDLIFREDWPGDRLDRPQLERVRELVKRQDISGLIVYDSDRLARNPIHIAILAEECQKHGVQLLFVTEPLDNSPEGMLIRYVKGYAAQIEREKIADRTVRGKRMRAKAGKIPAGCGTGLYGYDYVPGRGEGEGVRVINQEQAEVVRMIFRWLVEERMTLYSICVRLNEMGIPSPKGTPRWGLSTVARLLRNPAYVGKTYAFRYLSVEPKKQKNPNKRYSKTGRKVRAKEEWVELPNVTPPIITEETFKAAREQLRRNFEKAKRHGKAQYLLSGHIRCGLCGQSYNGYKSPNHRSVTLRYRCAGRNKTVSMTPCTSRSLAATYIENMVWEQTKEILLKPELLVAELQKRRQSKTEAKQLQEQIELNQKRLETLDVAETRALRLHLYAGMSEEKLIKELGRLKTERQRIEEENLRLNKQMDETKQEELDEAAVLRFCELGRLNIENFTFEQKRQALEALDIQVVVKPDSIAISGAIPAIVSSSSRWWLASR